LSEDTLLMKGASRKKDQVSATAELGQKEKGGAAYGGGRFITYEDEGAE